MEGVYRLPPYRGDGSEGSVQAMVQARAKRHPVHGSVRYLVRIEVRPREVVLWVNTFLLLNHSPLHIFGSRGNSTSAAKFSETHPHPSSFPCSARGS